MHIFFFLTLQLKSSFNTRDLTPPKITVTVIRGPSNFLIIYLKFSMGLLT